MSEAGSRPDLLKRVAAGIRWLNYDKALRERNRYVPRHDEYFQKLFDACLACAFELPAGSTLYRARIMPPDRDGDTEALPVTEMGSPPADITPEGRVNPAGIRCFYAALEPDTAIAELRPWPMARLSVATFTTAGPFNVLDLRGTNPRVAKSLDVSHAALMISRPVHRDDRFGYLGTQYLAERVKAVGIAGLLYASTLKPKGTNVALFGDGSGLKAGEVTLHEVTSVAYASLPLAPILEGLKLR